METVHAESWRRGQGLVVRLETVRGSGWKTVRMAGVVQRVARACTGLA